MQIAEMSENSQKAINENRERLTYIFMEHDKLKKDYDRYVPYLEKRVNDGDSRYRIVEQQITLLTERIPPNTDQLLASVKGFNKRLNDKAYKDDQRLIDLEKITKVIKKKQDLA